jgi:hypothetical protein
MYTTEKKTHIVRSRAFPYIFYRVERFGGARKRGFAVVVVSVVMSGFIIISPISPLCLFDWVFILDLYYRNELVELVLHISYLNHILDFCIIGNIQFRKFLLQWFLSFDIHHHIYLCLPLYHLHK